MNSSDSKPKSTVVVKSVLCVQLWNTPGALTGSSFDLWAIVTGSNQGLDKTWICDLLDYDQLTNKGGVKSRASIWHSLEVDNDLEPFFSYLQFGLELLENSSGDQSTHSTSIDTQNGDPLPHAPFRLLLHEIGRHCGGKLEYGEIYQYPPSETTSPEEKQR